MHRVTLGFAVAVALAGVLAATAAATGQTASLPFAVELRASQAISSSDCVVGQAVLFANSRAFTFHGKSFPVGALALGRLEQCKAPGHAGKGGVLEIRMEGLQLSDGEVFPLDGAAVFHGGSRVIGVAGGALAAGFILAPYVAPAALILRGKAAVMPVGTTIIATLGAGGGGSSRTPEKQAVPGNTGKGPG